MVMNKKIILIIIVAVSAFAVHYSTRADSDTREVLRRFQQASDALEKEPGETNFAMMRKAQDFSAVLAPTCTLRFPGTPLSGTYSAREAGQTTAQLRMHLDSLTVAFTDIEIEFHDNNTALATASGTARGKTHAGETFSETRELRCRLERIDGSFLFVECEAVEILRR